jgi:UDP-N-acetyl-2-amino-2-deoxyglucuronate dehydrogenase
MKKIKCAIIGCGRIAYKHVEALVNNHAQAELVAVCDVVIENGKAKAQEYADKMQQQQYTAAMPHVYTEYQQLLQQEDVDMIVIAAESGKHAEISLACLRAKKHVIVEKPMALSTKDADAMIACAKENGVKLCVSHQNRFNLPIQKLRQAVEAGRFGKIIAGNARILWNRNENYYTQAPWRGTYAQDGGCLMNQCIHNIDLLQWMMGDEIIAVQGMVANYLHPYIEAEDYGSIQMQFKNGAIGNVEGTVCVYPRNLEETLTILGEKGTVVIGGSALNQVEVWQFADEQDNLAQVQSECNNDIESVYGWGHTPLYADMIESIKQNREPLVSGVEGKKGMSIILHAYLASRQKQRVAFGKQDVDMTIINDEKGNV